MPENDRALRTPHNFAIFLLGYTGIIGLFLYCMLTLALVIQVGRCPRSRQKAGIVAVGLAITIGVLVENSLETPFAAIPTYLTLGILLQQARGSGLCNLRKA
jgi:O-antigen ligase